MARRLAMSEEMNREPDESGETKPTQRERQDDPDRNADSGIASCKRTEREERSWDREADHRRDERQGDKQYEATTNDQLHDAQR